MTHDRVRAKRTILRLCVLVALFIMHLGTSIGQTILDEWRMTGIAYSVVTSGNQIYVGGAFSYSGPAAGNGITSVAKDGSSYQGMQPKLADTLSPILVGPVYNIRCMISDNAGGAYIAGLFTHVDGVQRMGLARLNDSARVATSFVPGNHFHTIYAMAVRGDTLIVAGSENYITFLHAATGAVLDRLFYHDGIVRSLVWDGATLYVAGEFGTMGGTTRYNLAALSNAQGYWTVTAWQPEVVSESNGYARVNTLHVTGTHVFIGGVFDSVATSPRRNLARIARTTGIADAWQPDPDNHVEVIREHGGLLYVGGSFGLISGASRSALCSYDLNTLSLTSWSPNPNTSGIGGDIVTSILPASGSIIVGGRFTRLGTTTPVGNVVAFSSTTGQVLQSWQVATDALVTSIVETATTILLGGDFSYGGGVLRRNALSFDIATRRPTSWRPEPNGVVMAMLASPRGVILCGSFSSVNGGSRHRLCRVDALNGVADTWDPGFDANTSNSVNCLTYANGKLLVAGDFSNVQTIAVQPITAFDSLTDQHQVISLSSLPRFGPEIYCMATHGETLYIGGEFSFSALGGTRRNVAAYSLNGGSIKPWAPDVNDAVRALLISGDTVMIGGRFTSVNGVPRRYLAVVDTASGALRGTDYLLTGSGGTRGVWVLSRIGAFAYVGGYYQANIGGISTHALFARNLTSNQLVHYGGTYGDEMRAVTHTQTELVAAGTSVRWILDVNPVLPVSFESLTAHRTDAGVTIGWVVAQERSVFMYDVERLVEGDDGWRLRTSVRAHPVEDERNQYEYFDSWIDMPVNQTEVLYRLRSVDNDGTIGYSGILRVARNDDRVPIVEIRHYPQPARHHLMASIQKTPNEQIEWEMSDMLGRRVPILVLGRSAAPDIDFVTISVQNLAPGPYQLHAFSRSRTQRVMVYVTR